MTDEFRSQPATGMIAPYTPELLVFGAQRKGLGVTSLVIALTVLVLSLAASVLIGVAAASVVTPNGELPTTFESGFEAGASSANPAFGAGVLAHIALGSLLGGAAIVLGVIAIALKRGRGFGVGGVVIAAAAPILSVAVYVVTGFVAAVATAS